jgi:hypothetical protein
VRVNQHGIAKLLQVMFLGQVKCSPPIEEILEQLRVPLELGNVSYQRWRQAVTLFDHLDQLPIQLAPHILPFP